MESVIYLQIHYGLGDAIICRGIVLDLLKRYKKVIVPSRPNNLQSIKDLFQDHPEVEIRIIENDAVYPDGQGLGLGIYGDQSIKAESFDRWFYAQAGVDFERRFDRLPFLKTNTEFIKGTKLAFVHDDPSRGYTIDRSRINPDLRIIRPCGLPSIFDYTQLMEAAEEIHVIDSSFLHLCEHLERTDGLHYHLYARNAGPFHQTVKRKQWKILT